MKFARQKQEEASVNLTPLIDVVFLLLIFFMVSTTFTRETRLSVVLPEATGTPVVAEEAIEIVISSRGEYQVNGERLSRDDAQTLRAVLLPLVGESDERPVVLIADANAPHQAVVTVMDEAGRLGFTNLTISTQEPGSEQ